MIVQIPVVSQKFSVMAIGGFFRSIRRKDFGFCVSIDGQTRAAIIFPEKGGHRLLVGGLPTDVASYPDALVRVASEFGSPEEIGFGAVIRASDGNSYIQVSDGFSGGFRTFDLQTGLQTDLPNDVSPILYAHWKVGVLVDSKFEEIFSWVAP